MPRPVPHSLAAALALLLIATGPACGSVQGEAGLAPRDRPAPTAPTAPAPTAPRPTPSAPAAPAPTTAPAAPAPTTAPAAPAPPATAPAGDPRVVTAATGQLPASFPPSFPLPPQHRVVASTDNGRTIEVVIGVPDARAAVDFYQDSLPAAGWQIRETNTVQLGQAAIGQISVSNPEFAGEIAFGATGTTGGGMNAMTLVLRRRS